MLLETFAFVFVICGLLLATGVAYQQHGLRQDRRKHPAPGRLITVGNRCLHIYETGSGQPAVVFESGLASSSLTWNPVQQIVAQRTRAISYDRAGIGWSDEPGERRTLGGMVDDFQALLRASGNAPPYILVGHSFGALLARAHASLSEDWVAGLVLVDPVSLNFWADCSEHDERRLRLGAKLSRRGTLLAQAGVVRMALNALASGRTRLPQAVAKASAGKAMGTVSRLTGVVGKLPASLRPAVQAHWSQPKSFRAIAEYLEVLPQCATEARAKAIPAKVPVTILSAGNATAEEIAERELWVKQSIRGRHVQIAKSGHWIPLEHPEQVAAAVFELIDYLRESGSLNSDG